MEKKTEKQKRKVGKKPGGPIKMVSPGECNHEGRGSGRFQKNKDEVIANQDYATQHVYSISV